MTYSLEQIKQLDGARTQGNWEWHRGVDDDEYLDLEPDVIHALGQSMDSMWIKNPADAEYISACSEIVPLLVRVLELLSTELTYRAGYQGLDERMSIDYWLQQAAQELEKQTLSGGRK